MTNKISPAKLYALTPQETTYEIDDLNGTYYSHVPEINSYVDTSDNKRVQKRIIHLTNYDSRRYWQLASIWLDDIPVMIIQNAGREGDDYANRFITNGKAYFEMVAYLQSLDPLLDQDSIVDELLERDDLLSFYGDGISL